jgi:hypothetical protein
MWHPNYNYGISSFNYGIQTTIKEVIFHQTTVIMIMSCRITKPTPASNF